jgi:hypothetical protein
MKRAISFQLSAFSLFLLILWGFLVGCVPIDKPPQLTYTPGAEFVVTDETFDVGAFRVGYPQGWRVITGQASAPPSVIFAAPDDTALIMLAVGEIESAPTSNAGVEMQSEVRTIEVDDITITAYGTAPVDGWESFIQTFEDVLATVHPSLTSSRLCNPAASLKRSAMVCSVSPIDG